MAAITNAGYACFNVYVIASCQLITVHEQTSAVKTLTLISSSVFSLLYLPFVYMQVHCLLHFVI